MKKLVRSKKAIIFPRGIAPRPIVIIANQVSVKLDSTLLDTSKSKRKKGAENLYIPTKRVEGIRQLSFSIT